MHTKEDKIADPVNYYSRPEEVDADDTLTLDEKIILLQNWLDDIKLRLTAEEENMPAAENTRTYIADVEKLLEAYQNKKNHAS